MRHAALHRSRGGLRRQATALRQKRARSSNRPAPMLQLQRTAGNQALGRLLAQGGIQAKLTVNRPGDAYEQEADRVADQVMRMSEPGSGSAEAPSSIRPPRIQRMCPDCEEQLNRQSEEGKEGEELHRQAMEEPEEEEAVSRQPLEEEEEAPLQKMEGEEEEEAQRQAMEGEEKEEEGEVMTKPRGGGRSQVSGGLASRIQAMRGGGRPLPGSVRGFFQRGLGRDFGAVRIHTDSSANQAARALNARAFTIGRDVMFGAGEYSPDSPGGKRLLAHELAHTIQQGAAEPEVQRSCHDGKCDSCAGGEKSLWVTFFFRRSANKKTMQTIRKDLTDSKKLLKNCCINLKADFDWTLHKGGTTFHPGQTRTADPHKGFLDFPKEAEDLGASKVFDKAKGVPVMVVDDVPDSGGGVSVIKAADPGYTGKDYMVFAANMTNTACPTVAHELWHIGGGLTHAEASGQIVACTGHGVSADYCTKVRSLA